MREMMTKLTDFELNMAIAEKLGLIIHASDILTDGVWVHVGNPRSEQLKDYYNNWNDLMPLADKYMPELEFFKDSDGMLTCRATKFDIYCVGDSHQRALAECLLKVLEWK